MLQPNDKVKFLDDLWDEKRRIGLGGGLFGPPIAPTQENCFTVQAINIQNLDDIELSLWEFPWLVYADEVELIHVM